MVGGSLPLAAASFAAELSLSEVANSPRRLVPDAADMIRLAMAWSTYCSAAYLLPQARGLHSSNFQLNVSAFRGIGGAFRGY